jgi:protein N-terminal amidase
MAWLTREEARSYSRSPKDPDMETLSYWLARLEPIIRAETEGEIICVFANRTGIEDDAVYAGTSAVLGIHDGEVKVYGILGRGEKELLVVDTDKRPQAKLVSEPNSAASQFTNQASDTSHNSTNSMTSDKSGLTVDTNTTACTTPDPVELSQMIEDAMTPLSPVDPSSPCEFFAPQGRHPEADTLKGSLSTLKSSIGRPQISPAPADSPAFNRPASPKSRNASRNRNPEPSPPALSTYDLAEEERASNTIQVNMASPVQPHSAAAAPDRYHSNFSSNQLGTRRAHTSPRRPKSAMW